MAEVPVLAEAPLPTTTTDSGALPIVLLKVSPTAAMSAA